MKKLLIFGCVILAVLHVGKSLGQQRKVLIEQFTNSGCPPCAGNTPVVAGYVNAHSDSTLMIAYHTSFPYQDSMYHENPIQSDSRVAFYNIVGVPRSIVDGNYFSGNLLSTIATTLMTRAATPPRYLINFISGTLNGINSQVELTISFESLNNANQFDSLKAHVVLVEKNVLKSSYVCCAGNNTETEYPWVMRSMLPNENGTPLINRQAGGTDLIALSAFAGNFKNLSELRVIAFVQNTSTKEIYQAEISTPDALTSDAANLSETTGLFYFANPVSATTLDLQFRNSDQRYLVEISDVRGRIIYSGKSDQQRIKSIDVSAMKSGVYFISVKGNGLNALKKLIVL